MIKSVHNFYPISIILFFITNNFGDYYDNIIVFFTPLSLLTPHLASPPRTTESRKVDTYVVFGL